MNFYRGLNNSEVESSRALHGSNILSPPKKNPWYKLLLDKFKEPLIVVLIIAASISLVASTLSAEESYLESLGIIAAIFLATFVSFINEYKAEKEFDILNKVKEQALVKVIRADSTGEGKVVQIKKSEIVVGDYVILSAGDQIPADGTVLEATELKVDESSLNGESKPSSKFAEKVSEYASAFSPNKLYRDTIVSEGECVYVVEAVGDATEIGKTARHATEITGVETPLAKQLSKLGYKIGKAGMLISGMTFLILLIIEIANGTIGLQFTADNLTHILRLLIFTITLIVMAVPEGLPMSISLSLAYSMRRMTRQNALVRKMHACETMGEVTVICTDKTGTLTLNKMSVVYSSRVIDDTIANGMAINSTAFLDGEHIIGNPTEGALLNYLKEKGYSYRQLRKEAVIEAKIPFSSQRKYMATISMIGGKRYLFMKGAPEIVIRACAIAEEDKKSELETLNRNWEKGMRCLAFAFKELDSSSDLGTMEEQEWATMLQNLSYCGFVAIQDPIREDVADAVQKCASAGIDIKIVSGDTSKTAIEIARQCGIWGNGDTLELNSITGEEFAALNEEEAMEAAKRIKVMSRARPTDKMRLVMLLQKSGEIVAVTGDGTNDAPALNYANVGVAMGSGTSVAKESSDIIVLNDSFSTIVTAIEWGRSIYHNIQRFIYFQLTVNVAALLTALAGPLILNEEFPLTITQILWINLIMDTLAALALASEPSDSEVMRERPRSSRDFIVTKRMMKGILLYGTLMFAAGLFFLKYEDILHPSSGMSTLYLTIFFTFFVMMQLWNLFNVRVFGTSKSILKGLGQNKTFIAIALIILLLQIVIVNFGGALFRTIPLSPLVWLMIAVVSFVLIVPTEALLRLRKRQRNRSL